ncbi:MAG: DUF350 domain-containing protein [Ignavibacteriales bacterium]|nr:DUF350 domain-containing protein [Ignavibacteriales bacterium]
MDLILFLTGLLQIGLSLVLGVLFIYGAYKLFYRIILKIDDVKSLQSNNTAVAILNASIIISLIIIIKNSIDPAVTIFSNTLRSPNNSASDFLMTAILILLQILVAGVVAFGSIYLAIKFFTWLTKDLDEIEEIKKNNIAVSIVMAFVVFSIALLINSGIETLLDSLVPFPPTSILEIGR